MVLLGDLSRAEWGGVLTGVFVSLVVLNCAVSLMGDLVCRKSVRCAGGRLRFVLLRCAVVLKVV